MDQVFLSPLPFHFDRLHHSVFLFFRINILDFGFFFESFPSLAIWPTYCIRLSTFSFGPFQDLSALNLSIHFRNLSKSSQAFGRGLSLSPISYFLSPFLVEMRGLEPLAYALQRHRSPS